MFADVALNAPLRAGDRVFTFAVPSDLEPTLSVGMPVRVPFGRQSATGFVVALSPHSARPARAIAGVDDRVPALPAALIDLAQWMAGYYVCSVGEAIWSMIPPLAAAGRRTIVPAPVAGSNGPSVVAGDHESDLVTTHLDVIPRARIAVIADEERFDAYREVLRWLEAGTRSGIFLVPEIAQAEALVDWMRRHTSLPAAVIHGGVPGAQRWAVWKQVAGGAARIVVGTRLAVFAPLAELSVVVIDHEDDASYKEERAPRYDARRVAEARAVRAGAAVIWGTPVPSLEVMRALQDGRATAVVRPAPHRPTVAIADVRAEAGPLGGLFGRRLYQALARTLPRGRAVLFVPRRGFADFLLCHECGWVPRCPRCGVAMTYHVRQARLHCHLCGSSEPAPDVCARCRGTHLRPHGVGTERVEQTARRLFRSTPILRLDASSAADEPAQQRVWQQFGRRGGLLIGTQLLVKGIGQVPASVVGVIGVDAGLNLPDYRAAERIYQVLGRLRALAQREMIIQTFAPSHPVLRALAGQDPARFYQDELTARQRFHYPPYYRLVNLLVTGPDSERARDVAQQLALGVGDGAEVLGPSPAPLARVRGRYRWQVLVKEIEEDSARPRLAALLQTLTVGRGTKVLVDVDPVDLL